MKKRKKSVVIIALAALVVLLVPMITAVALQISGGDCEYWTKPPFMRADNGQTPVALETDAENETMKFGDYEKNFCLGYLVNFKAEAVTDGESAEEAERITRKNALLQEYRTYVDTLYMQVMKQKDYDAHYEHLMGLFTELLLLEPEETPEELLDGNIRLLLLILKDDLYYSDLYGEAYIKDRKLDTAQLKQAIAELTALQEKLNGKQLTFEQAQRDYTACLEVVKTASPQAYSSVSSNE